MEASGHGRPDARMIPKIATGNGNGNGNGVDRRPPGGPPASGVRMCTAGTELSRK